MGRSVKIVSVDDVLWNSSMFRKLRYLPLFGLLATACGAGWVGSLAVTHTVAVVAAATAVVAGHTIALAASQILSVPLILKH